MPATVTDTEGHEVRVITESDQLHSERVFRHWAAGVIGAVVLGAFTIGVFVSRVDADTKANTRRIEEVRAEGGPIVQAIKSDVALIREQQAHDAKTLEKISAQLDIERKQR